MILRYFIAKKSHLCYARLTCRLFSAGGGGDSAVKVFERVAKRRQRDRAAVADPEGEYDYLREHIAQVLVDRIEVRFD